MWGAPMASRTFLLLALLAGAAPAGPDPKDDPDFRKGVDEAVEKGVKWLLSRQGASGDFPGFEDARGEVYKLGMHALSTLAVVKGGQPFDSREVTKAYRKLDALYAKHRGALKTYEAGVTLMALDAKYFTASKKRRRRPKIAAEDLATAKQLATWLQRKQRPGGLWRYPEGGQDLSNTQYAALGLWSAHRLGVGINPGVVRRMVDGTLKWQAPEGIRVPFITNPEAYRKGTGRRSATTIRARGFRYMPYEIRELPKGGTKKIVYPYSGSMTSAGVAILAIGRDILGEKMDPADDRRVRKAMWEGLAWLQSNWLLTDNPGQPGNWPFYWIYGLERCARLAGVEYVGSHDWYHEGSVRLVTDQRPDGSWPKNQRMRPPGDQNVQWWSDQVDTCFAILFLTKSTPEIKTPPPAITRKSD